MKIYINDIGTVLRIHSNYSPAATLKIKKPDGTILTKSTTHTVTDDVNYYEYQTISGDLDQAGTYLGHLLIGGYYSDLFTFEVYNEYL